MARYGHQYGILKRMERCGVIPTVNLRKGTVEEYVKVARALSESGIDVMEILFRAEHDEIPQVLFEAIRAVRSEVPGILMGCGTLHTESDACIAMNHGAQFVVSSANAPEVIRSANIKGVVAIPAVETQEEVRNLLPLKPLVIKLFMPDPFNMDVSIERLKQFRGCFPRQEFTVTGVKNPNIAEKLLNADYPFVMTGNMGAQSAVNTDNWLDFRLYAGQYAAMVSKVRSGK